MNTLTKIVVALLVLVALGFVAWRYAEREAPALAELVAEAPSRVREALAPEPPAAREPAVDGDADTGLGLAHPIATDPTVALPALETSDAELVDALQPLLPAESLRTVIDTQSLIRRFVVTLDNLPGGNLPLKQRPVKPVPGTFAVTGEDDTLLLSAANYARYTPLIALAEQVDAQALMAVYRRYYPLFQQAYQELGYPDRYFNDRLVVVLDHLIAAEPVTGPVRLEQPHVLYRYADPALEARSPGEKILLRMGPENAARAQAVLREWRASLVAGAPAPD